MDFWIFGFLDFYIYIYGFLDLWIYDFMEKNGFLDFVVKSLFRYNKRPPLGNSILTNTGL